MEVKELQHRPATVCTLETSIADAARLMRSDGVGSVVVVDEHERLSGIVTDRDIVVRALADGLEATTAVKDVMTPSVSYLYENADIFGAAMQMAEHGFRRLPVLDAQGHLTGVVSFDDLVILFADQVARLGHAVRAEMPTAPAA